MIFAPDLAAQVLAGTKTVTRRPRDKRPCRYRVGRSYAVQPGRGFASIGRITIASVRAELLGDLNEQDARREGFRDRAAVLDRWAALYGHAHASERVWRIEFTLA